jgi:PAS domain S-box-containing protein
MPRSQVRPSSPGATDRPLQENREIYRLLVESVVDYAIFLLDPDGYIQTWNRGAERLKGYRAPEVVGRHLSLFYTEEDRARDHTKYELKIAAREGRYEEEGWRIRKDGTRFWANVLITALRQDGELVGYAKVTRDLTERRRAEKERENLLVQERQAREEAETANHAKSEFLSVMSHELRTPLNAIVGYADLLLEGIPEPVPEGPRRKVERMKSAAEYQLQLVEEILTYSRLESGDTTVTRKRVDLGEIARKAMEMVEPQAAGKGLSTRLDLPEDQVVVCTDPGKARHILSCLLSNAVKFSRNGEVNVKVEAMGEHAFVRVRDQGIGISPDDQERIFDSFWQAEQSTVREDGGMGLGLAICRRLAHLLGGDIEVESERGRGSTFSLRLPVEPPAGERP